MQKLLLSTKFIFSFSLMIGNLIINSLSVEAEPIKFNLISQNNSNSSENNTFKLPKAPQRGTPQGNKTPGATRPENFCPSTNQPVTALIANNGKDYTLANYPSFWFYIPYKSENINYIEFALKDNQTTTTIYRTVVEFKNESNFVKITIPEEEKYALETGKNYTWNLMLSCQGNESYEPDVIINGWIQKISITPQLEDKLTLFSERELYQIYLENEIWYDAINKLGEQYYLNPNNDKIKTDWLNFLESQNLTELDLQVSGYN